MFPLCITLSLSLALASHQSGSKQNLWGMHREKEERSSFVNSDADSAQHWLCATALSRVSTQRESVCFYRNAVKAKVRQGWQTRRKILQVCLIVPALLCRYGLKEKHLAKCTNFPQYYLLEYPNGHFEVAHLENLSLFRTHARASLYEADIGLSALFGLEVPSYAVQGCRSKCPLLK